MSVGAQSLILKASENLKACLVEIGTKKHLPTTDILFLEDDENAGVFLVVRGKVCLSMESMPKLDRLFASGSLLGLPSSFTGRPYTLTATAMTEAAAVHVTRKDFLCLMLKRPDLLPRSHGDTGPRNDLHPVDAEGASKADRFRENL
jgi:CRP-like cAMP-binding protein